MEKKHKLKKRIAKLEERITALELNSTVMTYEWGKMNFPKLCRELPKIIRKAIADAQNNVK